MPCLSLPNDASAIASSYCRVSKLRPESERDEVRELAASELRGERDPKHVGVGRVVDVVVHILEPAHLWEELGGREGLVALLDAARNSGATARWQK